MPAYDYECPECGVFELTHGMFDRVENCPHCGSTVDKLIANHSVHMAADWSGLNGGKGMYRGDMAKFPGDPTAYVSSRKDLINKLKATNTPFVTGV